MNERKAPKDKALMKTVKQEAIQEYERQYRHRHNNEDPYITIQTKPKLYTCLLCKQKHNLQQTIIYKQIDETKAKHFCKACFQHFSLYPEQYNM